MTSPASGQGGLQTKRGTPSYMPPELFQEGAPHSYASDLWALGCLLFEMAAGHPPFVSATFEDLVHSVVETEPEEIPGESDYPTCSYGTSRRLFVLKLHQILPDNAE